MDLTPSMPRQVSEGGLFVLWRDGKEPGRREGLACILSMCPNPGCECQDVYVDGFVVEENASAVCWTEEGVHLDLRAGPEPVRTELDAKMFAIVDPNSGETRVVPDLSDATDPTLLDWLTSQLDGELLEVLHRFRARAKGYPPERIRTDLDLDALEECHIVGVEELFEGTRSDEYIFAERRYWASVFLCPYSDCDCHLVRVVFFDDEEQLYDSVGSVKLNIGGADGFKIEEMAADCGAPEHLIRELWALFERRHDVEAFLRRREAQFKSVGETLWYPVAKPIRAVPKPGRNDPCPCGSGRKFKKCCLGKDTRPSGTGDTPRSSR